MNWRIIGTLTGKDLKLYFRSKLFLLLTVLGLAIFITMYFVMPSSVEQSLQIGLSGPGVPAGITESPEEGLTVTTVDSEEQLRQDVMEGVYMAGIALPADIEETYNAGETPEIILYFTPDAPEELKEALELMVKELAFTATDQAIPITFTNETLGYDTSGSPLAQRDRLVPMLAILILIMEMLGLANLMAEEGERGTAQALLVTPVSIGDLFIAKGLTGTGLAFVQSLLFIAIVGGLAHQAPLVIVTLLLGAIFVTGIAYIVAGISKDFMTVLGWGMLFVLIMILPSFMAAFPGLVTNWVKIIPSFYLVDTVNRAVNYGSGWGDLWVNLLILAGVCVVIGGAGIALLRRKFK